MSRRPMRDVVVVVPGIMGSVLERDGKDVWALSPSALLRAARTGLGSLDRLTLPEVDDPELDDLDGVRATRLFDSVHLVPGFWKIHGYSDLRRWLHQEFALDETSYLEVPYDWRRDIRASARRLAEMIRPVLERRRRHDPEARLILLCHSLGGLVARHFVECLDGWRDTRWLVTFGTPFRGSLNAVRFLTDGYRAGPLRIGALDGLLRSLTSVYQLLPTYACIDVDGELLRVGEGAPLPNIDPLRAKAALEVHGEMRDAAAARRDDRAYRSSPYRCRPMVGISQPTLESAVVGDGSIRFLRTFDGTSDLGDGTVPRPSAVPHELETRGVSLYAAQKHSHLQNAEAVRLGLLGILTENQTRWQRYRDQTAPPGELSLDVADLFEPDEPVTVTAAASVDGASLTVRVQDAEGGSAVISSEVPSGDAGEPRRVELPPLPPGTYEVTVDAGGAADPVDDLFVVA